MLFDHSSAVSRGLLVCFLFVSNTRIEPSYSINTLGLLCGIWARTSTNRLKCRGVGDPRDDRKKEVGGAGTLKATDKAILKYQSDLMKVALQVRSGFTSLNWTGESARSHFFAPDNGQHDAMSRQFCGPFSGLALS